MTAPDGSARSGSAVLTAIVAGIAGYLPAAYFYDGAMGWLRPMRHAEEAMGRGLETLFVGGPLVAVCLGLVVGLVVARCASPLVIGTVRVLIAAGALGSLVIARMMFI